MALTIPPFKVTKGGKVRAVWDGRKFAARDRTVQGWLDDGVEGDAGVTRDGTIVDARVLFKPDSKWFFGAVIDAMLNAGYRVPARTLARMAELVGKGEWPPEL